MSEIQETERIDYIMPFLQDLVRCENERRVEWVEWMKVSNPFVDIQTQSS